MPSERETSPSSRLVTQAVRPKSVETKQPTVPLGHLSIIARRKFVKKVLHLLYVTELVVLVEYTEVIMPLMYCANVALLAGHHNHEYYQFLNDWSSSSFAGMLTNVSVYIIAEFVSLFLMAFMLWWRLRFPLVHQLPYNLETRQAHVHAKLVGWEVYMVQNALVQAGADYSFRFQWLRHTLTPPSPVRLIL